MKSKLTREERKNLVEQARKVAHRAYAPYSRFRVGAAVLGNSRTYLGTNVENASSGLSLCAERSALAAAVANGEQLIRAVAVACIDAKPGGPEGALMPCGACRQWMAELAPGAVVLAAGIRQEFTVEQLMPAPFCLPAPANVSGDKKPENCSAQSKQRAGQKRVEPAKVGNKDRDEQSG